MGQMGLMFKIYKYITTKYYSLRTVFTEEEEFFEMFPCEMCGTIYMTKESYLTHFRVNECNVEMYPLPTEQMEISVKNDN